MIMSSRCFHGKILIIDTFPCRYLGAKRSAYVMINYMLDIYKINFGGCYLCRYVEVHLSKLEHIHSHDKCSLLPPVTVVQTMHMLFLTIFASLFLYFR